MQFEYFIPSIQQRCVPTFLVLPHAMHGLTYQTGKPSSKASSCSKRSSPVHTAP
jgi:hypothetical protein